MAARSPLPRKNPVKCGAPAILGTIVLDGGSGTPVIATGGDRCGLVDRDGGTNGVTDNGSGDHSIHLRDIFNAAYIVQQKITTGSSQTITSVDWDSTNNQIDIVLSADTADEVQVTILGFINAENDG